jgi:protocatechuate 3,4-dioxygenase alpha subunit
LISPQTPSQTVGPFFAIGLPWPTGQYVVPPETRGAITIQGGVYDGAGELVPDAIVETWQADPEGRFADLWDHHGPTRTPGFRGFARCGTDPAADGEPTGYEIVTLKPGRVPGPEGTLQAPHLDVIVMARGMLRHLVTRLYFADEPEANAEDPVLEHVPAGRRSTLLAGRVEGGYQFDIHLQGAGETVFFDV